MWELLREHSELSENDIENKILEIDNRDGRIDGKIATQTKTCQACGFDLEANDVGDGAAVFVIFIASILVVPLALVFQIKLDANVFLTLALFIPLIVLICLALLRPCRGVMFAMQIAHNAAEATRNDAH